MRQRAEKTKSHYQRPLNLKLKEKNKSTKKAAKALKESTKADKPSILVIAMLLKVIKIHKFKTNPKKH